MTRYAPLYQQEGSYSAQLDRSLIATLAPSGGQIGGLLSASGLGINVTPGTILVPVGAGQGCELCRWDATEQPVLSSGANPTAGQTRIDLVTCVVQDDAIDSGGTNAFLFSSVTGTPAASPVAPATPAMMYCLGQVTLGPGPVINSISTAPARLIAALAGTHTALSTGSAIQSMQDTNGEWWVAKNGVNGGAWLRARDALFSSMARNAAYTNPTAATAFPWDTVLRDPYGLFSGANSSWVMPVPGLWRLRSRIAITATTSGQSNSVTVSYTAAGGSALSIDVSTISSSGGGGRFDTNSDWEWESNAGGTVNLLSGSSVALAAAAGGLGVYPCQAYLQYIGPG